MAGGISMALVTTVLGLVAAMPLLLAHNILSSQAETIRNILEKQGISLVAEQAEKDLKPSQEALGNVA
jgi:biopolymer transport protein ExbB